VNSLADTPTSAAEPADVVVLTVIQAELFAGLDALGIPESAREKDAAGTIYYRGAIRSALARRDLRVAVTCIGGAGNPNAAAAVRDAIAWCRPAAVLLMGIAAGIRGKVRIGDVVLSERVSPMSPARRSWRRTGRRAWSRGRRSKSCRMR
jgi:nucleoside phosphorylase